MQTASSSLAVLIERLEFENSYIRNGEMAQFVRDAAAVAACMAVLIVTLLADVGAAAAYYSVQAVYFNDLCEGGPYISFSAQGAPCGEGTSFDEATCLNLFGIYQKIYCVEVGDAGDLPPVPVGTYIFSLMSESDDTTCESVSSGQAYEVGACLDMAGSNSVFRQVDSNTVVMDTACNADCTTCGSPAAFSYVLDQCDDFMGEAMNKYVLVIVPGKVTTFSTPHATGVPVPLAASPNALRDCYATSVATTLGGWTVTDGSEEVRYAAPPQVHRFQYRLRGFACRSSLRNCRPVVLLYRARHAGVCPARRSDGAYRLPGRRNHC